ncbi:MAG: hypothetical protein HZA01_10400 [Nitrospinae bacterium]|nr:hypothetical protein [Nitrospinota bacterium]
MATALPLEIYEILERKVGRDEAKEVIRIIDASLDAIEKRAEGVALQKKLESKDELAKELATKADMARLEGKMDADIARLEGRFEKLNQKLNFMIVLMVIALTLMNPVMAEVIKGFMK